MSEIDEYRKQLRLHGLGQILPVFAMDDSGKICTLFQCVPCEELVIWTDEGGCWVCPSCSYQLDRPHGVDILEHAEAALAKLRVSLAPPPEPETKPKKNGGRRRWLSIFSKKRRRRLSSS